MPLCGPSLAFQETVWDDVGQGQENNTGAACLPLGQEGVTQALAVYSGLE